MKTQEQHKYDLQELIDSMMVFVDESQEAIAQTIGVMKRLLDGKPVSSERIADEFQIPEDKMNNLLQVAELNKEGDIVGLGLSIVPTPHSCQVNGRQLYAWCAADAIMFPILLESGKNVVVESADPTSGEMVRLVVTPNGPKEVEPDTAVVSHPTAIENFLTVRANNCNATNFFSSVKTASQYVSNQPGLVIVPIDDVFQLWQQVWSDKKNLMHRG